MQMTTGINGTTQVITLSGRFDATDVRVFDNWLTENLAPDTARVVVNLGEVVFIDSTALSSLVTSMKRCRQMGGDLRLCVLQPTVRVIFELTRLDKAFRVYKSEAEAVASFDE